MMTNRIGVSSGFCWTLKLGCVRKQDAILPPACENPRNARLYATRDQEPLGILNSAGRFNLDIFMNPEQIKDEIRKLNSCDRIGLYRWINEEIAGRPGIGADRSLQIRKEIDRICKAAHLKTHIFERRKRESPRTH
jgi:hypothetical protein